MNIPYKLAKQLKDNGFPQSHRYNSVVWDIQKKISFRISNSDDYDSTGKLPFENNISSGLNERYIYQPTLSELIEECGLSFLALWVKKRDGEIVQWAARAVIGKEVYGKIPEETVAKLWLTIHKK